MIRLGLFFCLFLFSLIAYGQNTENLLEKRFAITSQRENVGQYLDYLQRQGIALTYSTNQVNLQKRVIIKLGEYKLAHILNLLLTKQNLKFLQQGKKVVIYQEAKNINKLHTVSGFVYVADAKETIPFANIKVSGTDIGTQTNDYGFYSLTIPEGKYAIQISHVGHVTLTDTLKVHADVVKNYNLLSALFLSEVKVTARDNQFDSPMAIKLNTYGGYPYLLGQTDPIKQIELKPGVSSTMSGLSVRGGSPDQNLVLLDGAPVYNYQHFGGLLSIFNNDAIKHIDFYRGAFPARYEGRLSSVIDVKTKDGDMEAFHGTANIGLLTSSATLEGPLIKQKMSFMISGRRSWIDGLIKLLENGSNDVNYNLYDINLKVNYIIDSTSRIYAAGYLGRDRFKLDLSEGDIDGYFGLDWGNKLLSLRWNKIHNQRFFQNTTVVASTFNNRLQDRSAGGNNMYNKISDVGINNDINYRWNNGTNSHLGISLNTTRYASPATNNGDFSDENLEKQQSIHVKAYTDNELNIAKNWNLNAGVHYAAFIVNGKTYHSFQPRTVLTYEPNIANRFQLSYATMAQFYHQITLNAIALPVDFRAPSNNNLPPEQSMIYEFAYQRKLQSNGFLGLSLYQKDFKNILMYRPQQQDLVTDQAIEWKDKLIIGNGTSSGLELEYEQPFNKATLKFTYTLSNTLHSFNTINNGKKFRAPIDMRNQLLLILTQSLGKNWSYTALLRYNTGHYFTAPKYALPILDENSANADNENVYYYNDEPNNYKLPDNFGADIGVTYSKFYRYRQKSQLYFGVNNLLNRQAPFLIETTIDNGRLQVNQVLPFKLLPYVGYSYSF